MFLQATTCEFQPWQLCFIGQCGKHQTMNISESNISIGHHIKGVQPVLQVMKSLGVPAELCLEDTGITDERLKSPDAAITLDEEFQFYRNLLKYSRDPMLGLKLGEIFRPETYGLIGYAILSAATLRESMTMITEFDTLTFTHFRVRMNESSDSAFISFSHQYSVPEDLIQVYSDRDIQATITGSRYMQGMEMQPKLVYLMHSDLANLSEYQEQFGCPVILGHHQNELHFDKAMLDLPLPKRNSETSSYCREQCQLLLNQLSQQGSLVESVRKMMVAVPGEFPSIEKVAEKLGMSVRSLRRHLDSEGSSYRQLLNEIRWQLARDYLQSSLPVEQIAELLGYSEPGNFSHAFKRWQGVSPKQYRAELTSP